MNLLKKYNVPGPRYTSYPTVPYWDTNPTEAQWVQSIDQALSEAAAQKVGAALYLHIPFCQSLCTYCGCNTRITRNREVGGPYIQTLLKEWKLYQERLGHTASGKRLPLTELHLGGGTPTFLSPDELDSLLSRVLETVDVQRDHEFSTEADPRVTTRDHLAVLAKLGFKRLSLGVQDFDPKVQDVVHRVQSEEQTRATTEQARELGYTSINFDLIYGLPFQTQKSIENTIDAVRRLRPDRIAFYAYAHVPWIKPSQRRFTEADLPGGDDKRALYELGRKMLEDVGYREIGMDHFALETDSLWKSSKQGQLHRNFMGYTARNVAPLIGLGVSSIGDSWRAFAQNEKLLETYQSRVEKGELPLLRGHVLSAEDLVLRRHILNLMTQMKTSWARDGGTWDQYLDQVPGRLQELVKDGLIEFRESDCQVTEKGRPFLRNVCMAFDARLTRQAPATQLFSQTI
ncbi:MAG: oxygen-independent coproporphyrinogen III oxidase [Bdellovibrionales bacterium]|nr:oxygen-independent coproporphyrinogen III oxidase [Bdellovibrionales bacterium]